MVAIMISMIAQLHVPRARGSNQYSRILINSHRRFYRPGGGYPLPASFPVPNVELLLVGKGCACIHVMVSASPREKHHQTSHAALYKLVQLKTFILEGRYVVLSAQARHGSVRESLTSRYELAFDGMVLRLEFVRLL